MFFASGTLPQISSEAMFLQIQSAAQRACLSFPITASLLTPSCSILVNVDGAGTTDHPVVIENNTLGSVTPHMFFICGKEFPGSAFNVLPGSFVEATSMPPPTQIKGLCP